MKIVKIEFSKADMLILDVFMQYWLQVSKELQEAREAGRSDIQNFDFSLFMIKIKNEIWRSKTGESGMDTCTCGHYKFDHDETLESCERCKECEYYQKNPEEYHET